MENGKEPITPCTIQIRQGREDKSTIFDRKVYGLTKREYFAGLAMQGILSALPHPLEAHRKTVSEKAIQLADELLTQLE
jgi:hypothetical protein